MPAHPLNCLQIVQKDKAIKSLPPAHKFVGNPHHPARCSVRGHECERGSTVSHLRRSWMDGIEMSMDFQNESINERTFLRLRGWIDHRVVGRETRLYPVGTSVKCLQLSSNHVQNEAHIRAQVRRTPSASSSPHPRATHPQVVNELDQRPNELRESQHEFEPLESPPVRNKGRAMRAVRMQDARAGQAV
ncbi:hypothetical protein DFH09DRAFT_1086918 [Mycena vulgaris]|nr:hypothetical protein DFH09DRAFT_1086918 [Mycena vulgaris]